MRYPARRKQERARQELQEIMGKTFFFFAVRCWLLYGGLFRGCFRRDGSVFFRVSLLRNSLLFSTRNLQNDSCDIVLAASLIGRIDQQLSLGSGRFSG